MTTLPTRANRSISTIPCSVGQVGFDIPNSHHLGHILSRLAAMGAVCMFFVRYTPSSTVLTASVYDCSSIFRFAWLTLSAAVG